MEFLLRARRAGACIVLDTATHFLHPGSKAEIHPILLGRFYAVVPQEEGKQFYQFRNRGYIFRRYGMWAWLAADVVRYAYYFMITRRADVAGLARWAAATTSGVRGGFMRDQRAKVRRWMPALGRADGGDAPNTDRRSSASR